MSGQAPMQGNQDLEHHSPRYISNKFAIDLAVRVLSFQECVKLKGEKTPKGGIYITFEAAFVLQVIDLIALGPFQHNGQGNYFDVATKLLDENYTYGEKTLDAIAQVLTKVNLLQCAPDQAGQT